MLQYIYIKSDRATKDQQYKTGQVVAVDAATIRELVPLFASFATLEQQESAEHGGYIIDEINRQVAAQKALDATLVDGVPYVPAAEKPQRKPRKPKVVPVAAPEAPQGD